MSLTSVVDTVTDVVIGILLVVAAAVAVVGLFRAYISRRRTELVITDIVAPPELPASLRADLSEELRRKVHRRLVEPKPRESLNNTVGRDLANRIAVIPGIDANKVDRIQKTILQTPRQELLASPGDALAAVSGGIRTLKPAQADGLIEVLSAALPGQRGLLVAPRIVCQQVDEGFRVGLSVQVGPLGRGAEKWATFWSQEVLDRDIGLSFSRSRWFDELPSLAAEWIIVYLIGALGVEGDDRQHHLRFRYWRSIKQQNALREILTAQWISYAMYDLQNERPDVALSWAEQALQDALHAKNSLPTYYYPSYLVGSIHDLCGSCHVALGEQAPDHESHVTSANDHFKRAADAFAEAETRLNQLADHHRGDIWRDRVDAMRIARLKCQLLMGNGRDALAVLDETEITPVDGENTMNAACLFAVASWIADKNGRDASDYRARACGYIIAALRRDPSVGYLRTDRDLNRGIARADLDWLIDVAPRARQQEIHARLARIAANGRSGRNAWRWSRRSKQALRH